MKNFNLMYHGSMSDVNDALEAGVELDAEETGALLSNITRKLAKLEALTATPAPEPAIKPEAQCRDCYTPYLKRDIGQTCGECHRGVIE